LRHQVKVAAQRSAMSNGDDARDSPLRPSQAEGASAVVSRAASWFDAGNCRSWQSASSTAA
jgi:hypothetical protein